MASHRIWSCPISLIASSRARSQPTCPCIICCATVLVEYVGTVGYEAPAFGKQPPGVYGEKPVAVREFDDALAMLEDGEVCRGDETAIRLLRELRDAELDIVAITSGASATNSAMYLRV
jgi:hypothetical protein